MQQDQGLKVWHVLNADKAKYFLVDVIDSRIDLNKTTVRYGKDRYQVKNDQLMKYDDFKPKSMFELRFISYPEIVDWLKINGADSGFVKINTRVALSFNKFKEEKLFDYLSYLLGRFLVTIKKVQYICIANDPTQNTSQTTMHESIMKIIQSKTSLWPYAVSLQTLNKLYSTFFSGLGVKFNLFVKESQIIKLEIQPFLISSRELFGYQSTESQQIFDLKSRIFTILNGSPSDMKRYFRVPQKSKTKREPYNVSHLIDSMMSLGLKLAEVTKVIHLFSLILNLNSISLIRTKRKGKNYFIVKQNSPQYENLLFILGSELFSSLQLSLNQFPSEADLTYQNITIKLISMMRQLWIQSILYVTQLFNQKLINLKVKFDTDVRKLILIEFPSYHQTSSQCQESHAAGKINQLIKEVALKIPLSFEISQIGQMEQQQFYKQIQEKNNFDFNKKFLQKMKKELKFQKQIRRCQFLNGFRQKMIRPPQVQHSQQAKQSLDSLLSEIKDLESEQNYFYVNFIIRSKNDKNDRPPKQIIDALEQSITEKHRKERQKMEDKLLHEFTDYQNGKINQKREQESEMFQVSPKTFEERYRYCELTKNIRKSKQSVFRWLKNYFGQSQIMGKVKIQDEKEIICMTEDFFIMLQKQRKIHEEKINKIKAQMKRCQYRRQVIEGLRSFHIRMRFYRWFCDRVYLPMSSGIKQIRKRAAIDMKNEAMQRYKKNLMKIVFNKFLKRASVNKLGGLDENLQIKSYGMLKRDSFEKLKLNRKWQRREQSFDLLFSYSYYNLLKRFMKQLQINWQTQRKKQSITRVAKQLTQIRASNLLYGYEGIQLCTREEPQPQIHINQPATTTNIEPQAKIQPPEKKRKESKYLNRDVDEHSNPASSIVGGERSESVIPLTKAQLQNIKDCPKFSFQSWLKDAHGFQKKKPDEPQSKPAVQKLFNKCQLQREPNQEPQEVLNVDILIKQKVVVNSFLPYLIDHVQTEQQQSLQQLMYHQSSMLRNPLLQKYKLKNYTRAPIQIFNNILKLGKDKNTTKSVTQLLNEIIKPLKDSYYEQKKKVNNVFQGEPPLINDYSWEHNIIKDQIFLQLIKQATISNKEEGARSLFTTLEIMTRYYFPSPQFLYAFLHYLKAFQNKNIQILSQCFTNTLIFAQAYEMYKGNKVTIFQNEVIPKEKQSYKMLEPRLTPIIPQQLSDYMTINLRLFNNEEFEYRVQNQSLSYFKRKLLKDINFPEYEQYFGVFYAKNNLTSVVILNESIKVIDFLIQYPQSEEENLLYVKLKYYFPFNLKEINKTRIMYLNSLAEERHLPWKKEDYQMIVALGMMYEEFQEYRIQNYLKITGQVDEASVDLGPIQRKYQNLVNSSRGQKISQFQYFKIVKDCDFIAAKGYRIKNGASSNENISRIVIKPIQLCFYEGTELKSSIHLKRVKSCFFQNEEIYLQIDYRGFELNGVRSLSLKDVDRANELYQDIMTYIDLLG